MVVALQKLHAHKVWFYQTRRRFAAFQSAVELERKEMNRLSEYARSLYVARTLKRLSSLVQQWQRIGVELREERELTIVALDFWYKRLSGRVLVF